jgi:glucose/arabinose dehydrogenase
MNIRLAVLAVMLLSTAALAQTPAPQGDAPVVPNNPDYSKVTEGQPIDGRQNENVRDRPAFSHQTRAPYHRTHPYKTTEITGALHAPWALAFLPDGKFLVTERLPGAFRVVSPDGTIAAPVSGLETLNLGWPGTGLFDVELDPDFARNHTIFFTTFGWDHGMISGLDVVRATFNEAGNSLSDVKIIFRTHPQTPNDAHSGIGTRSGGRIAIGKDGYLYITIGDRDAGTSFPWRVAQTLDTDLGKVIRITRDGAPAPGNPYVGQDGALHEGALPEIWAIGMRSQEGLTFDASGQLWEVEHGPRGGDELNLIKPGANYGWPIISHGIDYPGPPIGDAQVTKPGMEEPIYYWAPSTAPSGLAWYNANLFPEWKGSMLVGMLRGNSLERLKIVDDKVVNEEPLLTEVHMRIRDVRVGPDGAVYVLTDGGLSSITDNTQANSKLLKLTPQ